MFWLTDWSVVVDAGVDLDVDVAAAAAGLGHPPPPPSLASMMLNSPIPELYWRMPALTEFVVERVLVVGVRGRCTSRC